MQLLAVVGAHMACVIPQGLEEQQPAVNHRPRIVVRATQPVPELGDALTFDSEQLFSVPVTDADLEDTLYLRVFVDYDPFAETPVSVPRRIESTGTTVRTFSFSFDPCGGMIEGELTVWALVSDREFIEEGAYDGGGLPNRVTAGLTDETYWRVRCVPPTTTPDGGF